MLPCTKKTMIAPDNVRLPRDRKTFSSADLIVFQYL